jgi:hypothetical protein
LYIYFGHPICHLSEAARLMIQLGAITAAIEAGLKDHDRWLTARTCLLASSARRPPLHLPVAGPA